MRPELRDSIQSLKDYCSYRAREDEPDSRDEWREWEASLAQLLVDDPSRPCRCHPQLPLKLEYATDDVPWRREGHPGTVQQTSECKWKKDIANTSVSKDRLLPDEKMVVRFGTMGIEERAFAMLWDYEHNGSFSGGILKLLMNEEPIASLVRDEANRWLAQLVAQAVIQWLGTNCGAAFVDWARRIAEQDKKRLKEEQEFLQRLVNCPAGTHT